MVIPGDELTSAGVVFDKRRYSVAKGGGGGGEVGRDKLRGLGPLLLRATQPDIGSVSSAIRLATRHDTRIRLFIVHAMMVRVGWGMGSGRRLRLRNLP
jgi:hypothetical protein